MKQLTPNRVIRIIEAGVNSAPTSQGRNRIENMQLHLDGYAEPGYDGEIIVLGNFNDISEWKENKSNTIDDTPERVSQLLSKLESKGVRCEWEDEWDVCTCCRKLVRRSGDSYSWKRFSWNSENGVICGECVQADPLEYLESIENNHNTAITIEGVDPTEHGYVRVEEQFENGLYGGQSASPELIAKALREQGITRFLFIIDSIGQFDVNFSVYIHEHEFEKFDAEKFNNSEKDGVDPSKMAQIALNNIPIHQSTDEGISITTCDLKTGESHTKTLTPQQFVEGMGTNEI